MKNATSKISVIIPVYNVEPYLRQCLDSVINQTLKEIEIICVDDGSTDNSLEILKEYAAKDKRLKIISQINQGSAAARNYGIRQATGKYIGFIDADDYICKNYFKNLYGVATKETADIAATDKIINFSALKKFIKNTGIPAQAIELKTMDEKAAIIIASGTSCNKIYRKSFLSANNIQCLEIKNQAEDNYFTDISLICANKIAVTHQATYYYRINTSSQTHKLKTDKDFKVFDVYNQIKEKIKTLSLSEDEKHKWLNIINVREAIDCQTFLITMDEKYKTPFQKLIKNNTTPTVISLTSFPARIDTVDQTVKSLLNQTIKADKVILWLAPEQFPAKEKDLPPQLLALKEKGLTISWYNDIKSYKKLIPALRQYPEAVIITADDDILYPENWLELLLKSYDTNPTAIHCHRAHLFGFENGKVLSYNNWKKNLRCPSLSYADFLTGVGGVLYPPHCLHKDVLKEEIFTELCPRADDIWFWAMAVLNNTRIQNIKHNIPNLTFVPGTQEAETCLWKTNTGTLAENDIQLQKVLAAYPEVLPKVIADLKNMPASKSPSYTTRRYYLFGFIPFLKITEY